MPDYSQTRIQLRRGTSAQWNASSAAGTALGAGEPGWDTSSGVLKIGDGTQTWNQLTAISGVGGGGGGGGDITAVTAGSGLSGGGTTGAVTLNSTLAAGSGLELQGSTFNSTLAAGSGLELQGSTMNSTLAAGSGLELQGSTINSTLTAGSVIELQGSTVNSKLVSDISGITASGIVNVVVMHSGAYAALGTKNDNTIYFVQQGN